MLNILHMFIVTGLGNPSKEFENTPHNACLLYTSDAADELLCVDLGGRRLIKKKNTMKNTID